MPPLLLLLPTASSAAAAAAAAASSASATATFSRPPPPSRLRASHVLFAFPRLRKYGRRDREPVSTSLDEEDAEEDKEYDDDDDEEEEVDEDEFLKNRPKPVGFGVGKTYTTDIEERLLREMGLGGRGRRSSEPAPGKQLKASDPAKETGADIGNDGVHVRIWNLPKKKNIHKDLNLAFKGFPGLVTISPAISANKKTRDPICKGFAFLKLESMEAATRFVELYARKTVSFGKVQKPIKCCIVDGPSSTDPSNQASNSQAPRLNPKKLVAAS